MEGKNHYPSDLVLFNYSLEPVLLYLRDHELYCISFAGPRYNEYAIFINYHEWYLSKELPFYQYLKIIQAYKPLLQDINNHPVLIIMPIGYVESVRYYHKYFTCCTDYESHIFHFATQIFPDVHICPFDQHNSHVLIPLCYDMHFDISYLYFLSQTNKQCSSLQIALRLLQV